MNTLRFALIRFLVWLLGLLSTDKADPADVAFCYRLLLGRPADPAGWQLYLRTIRTGYGRNTLVDGFLDSAEFQTQRAATKIAMVDTDHFLIAIDLSLIHI